MFLKQLYCTALSNTMKQFFFVQKLIHSIEKSSTVNPFPHIFVQSPRDQIQVNFHRFCARFNVHLIGVAELKQ